MEYCAEYTILIEGAVWGSKTYYFHADDNKEACEIALQIEEDNSSKHGELMLDFIYDENGLEVERTR